jgi:hypothetical protein
MGPALFTVAGMAVNYFNQKHASDAAQSIEGGAAGTQQGYRTAALSDVNKQAQNIATSDPNAVAAQNNGKFVASLRANQSANNGGTSGPTSALGPVAGANKRYGSDAAASAGAVQKYGETNAADMSALDSAITQRQNEGLANQTLATTLNGINQQSYRQNFVDQMRAKIAGTPNPWVGLVGKGLEAVGGGMAQNGWFSGTPDATSATGQAAGNTSPSGYLNQGGYLVNH